jgi:hypothetical protein
MTDLQIEVAFRFCEITGTTCPFYWNKYEASILFVPSIANVGPSAMTCDSVSLRCKMNGTKSAHSRSDSSQSRHDAGSTYQNCSA